MDLSLMYRGLATGQVDVVAGDATSGLIDALDFSVLEDDRRYFPPYDAVPLVRSASLLRHPDIRRVIDSMPRISEKNMRAMNRAVDLDHREVGSVVREYLSR